MKKLLAISVFLSVAAIGVVRYSFSDIVKLPVNKVLNQSVANMTYEQRQQKLNECAKCHAAIFHNEMIGPHANAYTKLTGLLDEKIAHPASYLHHTEKMIPSYCVKCHAAENLFETTMKGVELESDEHKFSPTFYADIFKLPNARKDTSSWKLGVDCLTCHTSGNTVVGTLNDNGKSKTAVCNPVSSKIMSANENCTSCHFSMKSSMTLADNIHNLKIKKSDNCNGCHIEKNASGKKTHYYFWRHDPAEKDQYKLLKLAFNSIKVARDKKSADTFNVGWENDCTPHSLAQCTELLAVLKFKDEKDNILYTYKLRANDKINIDTLLAPLIGLDAMPGESGYLFLPDLKPLSLALDIKNGNTVKYVSIECFEKAQFWVDDKRATRIFERIIKL